MKLLILTALVCLMGVTMATYSIQDLVDALKEFGAKEEHKKEVEELSDTDFQLAQDLVAAVRKRGLCPTDPTCTDLMNDPNGVSKDVCLTMDCDDKLRSLLCPFTCHDCYCPPLKQKKSFASKRDAKLGLKLLAGFKKVLEDP